MSDRINAVLTNLLQEEMKHAAPRIAAFIQSTLRVEDRFAPEEKAFFMVLAESVCGDNSNTDAVNPTQGFFTYVVSTMIRIEDLESQIRNLAALIADKDA